MSPSTLGDFSKFPAEIRNEMYRLVLIASTPVKVDLHQPRRPKPDRSKLCGTVIAAGPGQRKRRVACSKVLTTTLLRASRAFNVEASPILYSANTFVFHTVSALDAFLTRTREMALLLSDVVVKSIGSDSNRRPLERLRMLSRPRRIVIDTRSLAFHTVAGHARHFWDRIKPIVMRKGSDVVWSKHTRSFRSHLHDDFYGHYPRYNYGTDTKEIQFARLQAFEFVLSAYVDITMLEFHALVVACWRADFAKEERLAALRSRLEIPAR